MSSEECVGRCTCGGSVEQCGHACECIRMHRELMALSVNVRVEHECCLCSSKWLGRELETEWCIRLPLSFPRSYNVAQLVRMHCVEGVNEYRESKSWCSCAKTDLGYSVKVRQQISCTGLSRGEGFAVLANAVHVDAHGRERKYVDRSCTPSLYVVIGGTRYILDSFIEHRPLSIDTTDRPDIGHYVAYVRLSDDGEEWKVANDGDEYIKRWNDVSKVHGHIFFYKKVFSNSLNSAVSLNCNIINSTSTNVPNARKPVSSNVVNSNSTNDELNRNALHFRNALFKVTETLQIEEVDAHDTAHANGQQCAYVYVRGVKKGLTCTNKPVNESMYCKNHKDQCKECTYVCGNSHGDNAPVKCSRVAIAAAKYKYCLEHSKEIRACGSQVVQHNQEVRLESNHLRMGACQYIIKQGARKDCKRMMKVAGGAEFCRKHSSVKVAVKVCKYMYLKNEMKKCTHAAVKGSDYCKRHSDDMRKRNETQQRKADSNENADTAVHAFRAERDRLLKEPWPMVASDELKAECVSRFKNCIEYETDEYACAVCGRDQDIDSYPIKSENKSIDLQFKHRGC